MSKSNRKTKLVCIAGEHYWLEQELAKARLRLQNSLFQESADELENKQESTQAYTIIINFFQRAVKEFEVEPGTKPTPPIRISNAFIRKLKTLDKNNLINIDVVPKD